MTDFTYTDAQWNKIKAVVFNRLRRDDADQIEFTRTVESELTRIVGELTRTDGSYTTTTSLRSSIKTAASRHIADSALHSQTPGHKARIKKLKAMRIKAEALHNDLVDAIRPSFTLGGDDSVRHVILGGHLRERYGLNVDPFDATGRAFATVISVIDASIAAQRPQQTANTSKTGRDRFWNEMLAVWTGIGGAETGTAAAEFLVATSKPVFDKLRAIGAHKTTFSAVDKASVVEWLRVRAKTRQAATS